VTEDDGGVRDRSSPALPRQRPDLGAPNDCDEPSLDEDDWPIDDLDDWPFDDPSVDIARLRESLMESEADIAAGRTFGEDEIRTDCGLPRK
jgi:hypothetical protein